MPPAAAVSGSGFEIVQDPADDHETAGLASDLLRVGARTESNQVRFFVKVQDAANNPFTIRYRLGFTVVGGLSYYATVSHTPAGALQGATLWRAVPETARISGNPITADWLGSELRLTIARSLMGNPADGTELAQITAASTSMPTGASEVRSTITFYDETDVGSYELGQNPPLTVPTEPIGLSASGTLDKITISWSEPASNGGSDILQYNVYRGTASGSLSPRATVPANARAFQDTEVVTGTRYYYRVTATNAVGEGAASAEVSAQLATPTQPNPPSAPRNLVASGGNGAIFVEWAVPASNGGASIQAYSVYRGGVFVANATDTNFYDDGLQNGQAYCYNVTAWNSAGQSAPSPGACGTPMSSPPPSFPVPSQATGIGPGSHLFISGIGTCTANFVWTDGVKRYLGSAGHCFLPGGKTATHGPGADYNASGHVVRVCVSSCLFGGAAGSFVSGNLVTLGKVVYARQQTGGAEIGHDFGIVEIPPNLWHLIRTALPVYGGPVAGPDGRSTIGSMVCHYGNGIAVGEVMPTMSRAGFGVSHNDAQGSWGVLAAAAPGDSGSAIVMCSLQNGVLRGGAPLGVLTHLAAGGGVVWGTTIAKAKAMALQANINLSLLYGG